MKPRVTHVHGGDAPRPVTGWVEYTAEVDTGYLVLVIRSASREMCLPQRVGAEYALPAGDDAERTATEWIETTPEYQRSHDCPPEIIVRWTR